MKICQFVNELIIMHCDYEECVKEIKIIVHVLEEIPRVTRVEVDLKCISNISFGFIE